MSERPISLVADIGGTFARFALVSGGAVEPTAIRILRVADYATPADALADYLSDKHADSLSSACLAVAGPVENGRVQVTNTQWKIDPEDLKHHFGWSECDVINDFQAAALGVPWVPDDQLISVCDSGVEKPEAYAGDLRQPALVLGPGTGFGLALLTQSESGWIAQASEAGHMTFGATSQKEWAVLEFLQKDYGSVSVERLLSGPGLMNLYRAHATLAKQTAELRTPEQVTHAARNDGDALAQEVLAHFLSVLGRVTGDALLMHGSARKVFLCGGMLPNLMNELIAGPFCASLVDKGRMRSLVESTPIRLVTDPLLGLRGAACYLSQK